MKHLKYLSKEHSFTKNQMFKGSRILLKKRDEIDDAVKTYRNAPNF